jgi:hypothetical protein
MGRFLVGLAAIDAAIVLLFGTVGRHATVAVTVPVAVAVTAAKPDAGTPPPLWKGVDAADLAKRVADLYLGVRRHIGKNKKVILAAPKRVGDDVEVRVSLSRAGTFPAGLYCFHCAAQRCLFPEPTLAALEVLTGAFDAEAVHALAAKVGKEHVQIGFVGGASAGPLVPKSDAQVCDGPEPRIDVRSPPAYDGYDGTVCGAASCELAESGETVEVGAGIIDDNKKLACLRAMCTRTAAAGLSDLPSKIIGELAFEQGGAFRGAEVVLTLRGVAAPENREAFLAFWAALTQLLGDDK